MLCRYTRIAKPVVVISDIFQAFFNVNRKEILDSFQLEPVGEKLCGGGQIHGRRDVIFFRISLQDEKIGKN
jgi:hypothetical protein